MVDGMMKGRFITSTVPHSEYRLIQLFRCRYDVGMPHEFQGSSGDRYEWRVLIMRGQDNVPHTIVTSYHVTGSLEPILRGELLAILRVTWWKTKVVIEERHKVTPILIISIRPSYFQLIEAFYNGSSILFCDMATRFL
ncbi:hypothetical protein ACJ73_05526 [Blastomyces percursus]|uniref:Uncharacterized protein n=1 Tax=Blastomyces percursus TaxID=1658174 RepID=A0A1J9Q3J2_9EURO|nr:hypothetical protein ACJ73_05526 [Blastomyces percursus]